MRLPNRQHIVVIGGGAWGAGIAHSLVQNKQLSVQCLVRDEITAKALADQHIPRLPNSRLDYPLLATTEPTCLASADMIYVVIPASATLSALSDIQKYAPADTPVVLCAKGLVCYQNNMLFLPEVMTKVAPERGFAILSGPSFADEVIANLPTALVAASDDAALCQMILSQFTIPHLRLYHSDDAMGVAICGALKNIIALAAGICEGLGLGDNAKAALITRGLAEMARLITALGGKPVTISGLAGIGDLALTANGPHSRNMAYGLALGRGKALPTNLCEGARSAPLMSERAEALGIEMPITKAVLDALNGAPLSQLITDLLARPAVKE